MRARHRHKRRATDAGHATGLMKWVLLWPANAPSHTRATVLHRQEFGDANKLRPTTSLLSSFIRIAVYKCILNAFMVLIKVSPFLSRRAMRDPPLCKPLLTVTAVAGCKSTWYGNSPILSTHRTQELCESRGGRPGLLSLMSLWSLWMQSNTKLEPFPHTELRSCVKVEMAVLGSRPQCPYGLCWRKATFEDISTSVACSLATAKQRFVARLWSRTRSHSSEMLTLCCCVACGCGVSPMCVAAILFF